MRRLTLLSNVNIATASLSGSQSWRGTWRQDTTWRVYSSNACDQALLFPLTSARLCAVCVSVRAAIVKVKIIAWYLQGADSQSSSDYKHSDMVIYMQLIREQRPNKNALSIDQVPNQSIIRQKAFSYLKFWPNLYLIFILKCYSIILVPWSHVVKHDQSDTNSTYFVSILVTPSTYLDINVEFQFCMS